MLKGLRLAVIAASVVAASSGCTSNHDVGEAPGPAATSPAATSTAATSTAPTSTAAPEQPSPVPAVSPSCTPAAVLSTWILARRAAQLVVVPAEEDDPPAPLPDRAPLPDMVWFGPRGISSVERELSKMAQIAQLG